MSRRLAEWLPGPAEWYADGEINGHTFAETIAWVSLSMDLADKPALLVSLLPNVVSPDLPRRWWRRRWA